MQTIPKPGPGWQPEGQPARQPHQDVRAGTAKVLTLFHPASGQVRVKGVTSCPNAVLHPWLQQELTAILATLPEPTPALSPAEHRALWAVWQEGLTERVSLLPEPPPLRLLLIWDNLAGHKTPELLVWLFERGIMPLYTPLGGSWLNMAESIQRILKRRALDGQQPPSPAEIGTWFEQTAEAWNRQPTPFVWNGKRRQRRRKPPGDGQHRLGGSAAYTRRPLHRLRSAGTNQANGGLHAK